MSIYRNGPYHVEVAGDGAIKVKAGDWLSKYSAAINNDFLHVHDFGRKNRAGVIEPVAKVNLIYAGEVLYYLPTYQRSQKSAPARPAIPRAAPMPDSEKKKIILETLKKDYHLRGDHLPILNKAIDIIGYADNALTLAEIAGLIAEGGALAAAGTATSILSTILFPVGATIELLNAWETGERLYGMMAVTYTMTAWAFGDAIPTKSQRVLDNVRQVFPKDIPLYQQAWHDASVKTLSNLTELLAKRKIAKESYQILLRAIGDDQKNRLCLVLRQGFEKQLHGTELATWQSNYSIDYPD